MEVLKRPSSGKRLNQKFFRQRRINIKCKNSPSINNIKSKIKK